MAEERGCTFTYPTTSAEARAEFKRLKAIPREGRAFREKDAASVRASATTSGGAARVQRSELTGYGSAARWKDSVDSDGAAEVCERCGVETTDRSRIGGRLRYRCSDFSACFGRRRGRQRRVGSL
jgi:hypothetical protein